MNATINRADELRIGRHVVAADAPTVLISEIGINHQGDVSLAKQLVDLKTGKVLVRNLNHATAVYSDSRKGAVVTADLQAFLVCFGAKSTSAASNRLCMQRSAQSGENKYRVNKDDVAQHAIATTRGGTVRKTVLATDELASLNALLKG